MADKPLTKQQKQALAVLRPKTASASSEKREQFKKLRATRKAINELLQQQPATVAQIAEALKMPRDEVFWHIIGMRKYGLVRDEGEDGEYIRYALVSEPSAEPAGH